MTISLTAAADVPEFANGAAFADLSDVAKGVMNRTRGYPKKPRGKTFLRHGVAVIGVPYGEFSQDNPAHQNLDALLAAAVAEQVQGDSLVAGPGWSSPSQVVYDLCQTATADGILSLPEVGITRGGERFTREPDFETVEAGVGWDMTEAQVIADTPKTWYEVPTPDFVEVRLGAQGVAVKAGLLQNAAYPELVRNVIEKSLIAHQRKVAASLVTDILTDATTEVTVPDSGSLSVTMASLAFIVESEIQKFALARSQAFEVLLPHWLRIALKVDIGMRTGRPAPAVPDAEVNALFAQYNLAPQFVYGLDDLNVGEPSTGPGASTTAVVYPAGTYVKGGAPIITLDTVYDTTDLATNVYSALFTEEGVALIRRCHRGVQVDLPVTISGATGAADLTTFLGTEASA